MNKIIALVLSLVATSAFAERADMYQYQDGQLQGGLFGGPGPDSVFNTIQTTTKPESTTVRGAVHDDIGDSRAALARMANNRQIERERQKAEWPTPVDHFELNGQPVANTATRDRYWYGDSFFIQHEDSNRVRLDAWTYQKGYQYNSIVMSCVYDKTSHVGNQLKFFIRTTTPLHNFGATINVKFIVGYGGDEFELPGIVSNLKTTNVHVDLEQDTAQYMIQRMRSATQFRVVIQPVSSATVVDIPFSLMGFSSTSSNTISNCMRNVE